MLLLLLSMVAHSSETLVAWSPLRVTLGLTNVQTAFIIPADCRYIQIKFETNDGYLSTTESGDCTDAATKDATDYFGMAADTWHELRIPGSKSGRAQAPGGATMCLSAAAGSTVVNVMCTSDHD